MRDNFSSHSLSMTSFTSLLACILFTAQFMLSKARPSSISADFVVVGAGTAGCALAGRLCANLPNASIILLERGTPRNKEAEFLVRAPRTTLASRSDPQVAESYDSEPNPGLLGRPSNIITGKTLGGSSSVNGMQWSVPVDGTIDEWNIAGLSSRNWLKYLRRVYRTVGFGQPPEPLQQIYTNDYVRAGALAGFPIDDEPFSDKTRNGVWLNRLAIDENARRLDSCTAYVSPVIDGVCRNNLKIVQSATVSRVLLDDQTPLRAYGVEVADTSSRKVKKRIILAKKEVLVAAGPYESPKLLQLSGIGPRDVLRKAGVSVRANLDVGMKSQARAENVVLSVSADVPPEPSSNETLVNSPEERMKWERGEGGVLGVAESAINGIMKKIGYFTASFRSDGTGTGVGLGSICFPNPKSFGHVRIRDDNPFSPPSVQLNLLSKKSEVRSLLACQRRLRAIHNSFNRRFNLVEVFPSPAPLSETLARNTSGHALHFVGGCSVGTTVNSFLQVKGVHGLRVIDSSVFKSMPTSSGPLAVTYMLAEFMAERLSNIYK